MPDNLSHLSIVIPCFNESHEVLDKLSNELRLLGAEVIIVDDGSHKPYPNSIKHGVNFGYGSALMTGIKNSTNQVIMTVDGDGEHKLDDIIRMYDVWKLMEKVDMLIGVRRIKKESLIRFLGRKVLNSIASILCLYWLSDLNSGMRIFKKDVVSGYFPILCKTFSFTTSLTLSMLIDGYQIEWFPIRNLPRTYGKSKVKVIRDGFVTLYYILWIGLGLRSRKFRGFLRSLIFWRKDVASQ
jgi:glycosyltransferase involved in cell wall biosynthesis